MVKNQMLFIEVSVNDVNLVLRNKKPMQIRTKVDGTGYCRVTKGKNHVGLEKVLKK